MKKFKHLRQESMVPQWLHKMVMAPKMKKLVRAYLNWRKKNPGQGARGVQQAIKMMGLSPRDGNQLIDTLNDMIKQGKLPKHLAIAEETDKWYKDQPEWGTPESTKKAKKITPGESYDPASGQHDPNVSMGYSGKHVKIKNPSDPKKHSHAFEIEKESTAKIRINRALKKHGVGKHDDYYLSKMDPETRKKYEPKKRPPPAQVSKPTGSFKWFATRDVKKDN